jgi:hypothetical protein
VEDRPPPCRLRLGRRRRSGQAIDRVGHRGEIAVDRPEHRRAEPGAAVAAGRAAGPGARASSMQARPRTSWLEATMEPQIKAAAGDVDAHTLRSGFASPSGRSATPPSSGHPAWFVGGHRGTRVLFVHGDNAPAGRRCACSGWWPARGSRRWAQLPQRSPGPGQHRPPAPLGGDRVARRRGGDQLRPGPRRARGTLPLLGLPVPAPLTATDPLRHLQRGRSQSRGVTRGRGSMRAWRLDLVRFR